MNPTVTASLIGVGGAVVVAVVGFWASVRNTKQVLDHARDERLEQWHREDSLRWLPDRQQCYARFISALHEWEASMAAVRRARMEGELVEAEALTDIKDRQKAVWEALSVVQLWPPGMSVARPTSLGRYI